jgi:hypothetical protein
MVVVLLIVFDMIIGRELRLLKGDTRRLISSMIEAAGTQRRRTSYGRRAVSSNDPGDE